MTTYRDRRYPLTETRPALRLVESRPKSRIRYYGGIVIEAALIAFAVWGLIVVASGVPR